MRHILRASDAQVRVVLAEREAFQMKFVVVGLLFAVFAVSSPTAEKQAPNSETSTCCDIALRAIKAAQAIKPGMKRSDLTKNFYTVDALMLLTQSRWAYAECPYIKIDVTFGPDARGDLTDTITSVSIPYLNPDSPSAD
jgi:hypothetical protein